MISLRTTSAEETRALGVRLGSALRPGDVLTLAGPFGAGKTTFVQGLAAGMGLPDPVTSPSFALVDEHPGPLPLYHLDLYRLRSAEEAFELGIEELAERGGVLAVEWPEVADEVLPPDRLAIELEPAGDDRVVRFDARGERSRALLAALG